MESVDTDDQEFDGTTSSGSISKRQKTTDNEMELLETASGLAKAAVARINTFWTANTDYKGPKITLSEVRSYVDNSIIEMSAKCLGCGRYIKFNMVLSRSFSMQKDFE